MKMKPTVTEQLAIINYIQTCDRPGYSVRFVADNDFTYGSVQVRKSVLSGWFFAGYADDLLRRALEAGFTGESNA